MKTPVCIETLRSRLLAALHQCPAVANDRARVRIMRAASAQELWLERSDLFQLIARRHGEAHAQLILGVNAGHLTSTVENF